MSPAIGDSGARRAWQVGCQDDPHPDPLPLGEGERVALAGQSARPWRRVRDGEAKGDEAVDSASDYVVTAWDQTAAAGEKVRGVAWV